MSLVGRLSRKIKGIENDILFTQAIEDRFRKPKHIILAYHGIDSLGKNQFNTRHTKVSFFRKQIAYLKRNFQVVGISDFFFGNYDKSQNCCAITFDDGYLNNYQNAFPVLQEFNCKATFFVTGLNQTDWDILWADYVNIAAKILTAKITVDEEDFYPIDGQLISKDRNINMLDVVKCYSPETEYKSKLYETLNNVCAFKKDGTISEYWKLMTDEQIVNISKNQLFEIGSHGFYHNNLGNIDSENALAELVQSKKYIEELIQKPVMSIGYPDGSYNHRVLRDSNNLGMVFQMACDGIFTESDNSYSGLRNRAGVYNIGSAGNQLFDALDRNQIAN